MCYSSDGYFDSKQRLTSMSFRQVPSQRPRCIIVASRHLPAAPAMPAHAASVVSVKEAFERRPLPAKGDRLDVGSKGWLNAVARLDGGDTDADGTQVGRAFNHLTMDKSKPSHCILTAFDNQTSGQFLIYDGMLDRQHPDYPGTRPQFRKMSHQQAMRLMSFDIAYPFHGTNKEIMTQIGNAIPPEFARRLLVHLTTKVVTYR